MSAANIPMMRDPSPSPRVAGKWKRNTYDGYPEFYNERGKKCRNCPAGYHVQVDCESPETRGTCLPCKEGTDYTEHPNGLPACLPCRRCKADEEVVSSCTSTRNTVCRCREGTYCPPEHPCEVCLSCTASCPEGGYLMSPCNATADIQCTGPTDSPSENTHGHRATVAAVAGVVIVIMFIIIFIVWWKKFRAGRHSDSKSCLWHSQGCRDILKRRCMPTEGDDNEQNRMIEKKILLAETGDEPEDLHHCFYVFIDNVPIDCFRKFLRELKLPDNEILVAAQNHPRDVKEQYFQLLHSWLDRVGMEASVNTLLSALCRINLRGVAEKIADELVQTSKYKYDMED